MRESQFLHIVVCLYKRIVRKLLNCELSMQYFNRVFSYVTDTKAIALLSVSEIRRSGFLQCMPPEPALLKVSFRAENVKQV